jgi:hypothetical protein
LTARVAVSTWLTVLLVERRQLPDAPHTPCLSTAPRLKLLLATAVVAE